MLNTQAPYALVPFLCPHTQCKAKQSIAIGKAKGTVGDYGGAGSAIAPFPHSPFPIPQIPFFVLVARREGN